MNKLLLEWLDVPPNLVDQTWHVVLQRPWPTWLQVLVLMALFGKSQPQRWAFYVLAGLDVLAAIIMAIFWSSIASQVNDIWTLAVPVIGVLVLKAVLTVLVARKLPPPPAAAARAVPVGRRSRCGGRTGRRRPASPSGAWPSASSAPSRSASPARS